MEKIEYYRVSQFEVQPANAEDLKWLVAHGKAEKVKEDFEPYWGGGVYQTDGESIKLIKSNWDSSD